MSEIIYYRFSRTRPQPTVLLDALYIPQLLVVICLTLSWRYTQPQMETNTTPLDPAEILAKAAEAARAAAEILPALERDYAKMEAEMSAALKAEAAQIEEVRILAQRHKKAAPPAPTTPSFVAALTSATEAVQAVQDHNHKSAVADMEYAMREVGPISVPDMIEWMDVRTKRKWAASTLYNLLKKGKDASRYVNVDNKWRMATDNEIFGKSA